MVARDRLADGRPRAAAAGLQRRAPTWSRITSPTSTPPRPSRCGRGQTYRQGLHCIAASPWLAELLRRRYGASATHFDLAVDHDASTGPRRRSRREDLVVFYARAVHAPARRAARPARARASWPQRRPELEIVLFGEDAPARTRLPSPPRRRTRRAAGWPSCTRSATVGHRAVADQPVAVGARDDGLRAAVRGARERVDARHASGRDGPLLLAEPTPGRVCAAIEELLDDPVQRAARPGKGTSGWPDVRGSARQSRSRARSRACSGSGSAS